MKKRRGHDGFLDTFNTLSDHTSDFLRYLALHKVQWADSIPKVELSLLSHINIGRLGERVIAHASSQRTSRCC